MPAFPSTPKKDHFTNSIYWNDFKKMLSQDISNMDIIKFTYAKLVETSLPFDMNELWKPFVYNDVKNNEYTPKAAIYLARLGADVNYLVADKYNSFPVWSLSIWNKDKPTIEYLLTEFDCDLTFMINGKKIIEYYSQLKGMTEFVNSCLEKRKVIKEKYEMQERIDNLIKEKEKLEAEICSYKTELCKVMVKDTEDYKKKYENIKKVLTDIKLENILAFADTL